MIRCHAGILCLLACLSVARVTAQTGDTVRVDQDTSTITATDKEGNASLPQDTAAPVFRSIPDSIAARWRKDPDFAYANDPAYWQQHHRDDSPGWLWRFLSSRIVRYFFWILLGAVLLYTIIRIITENNMRLFYRSPGKKGDARVQEPAEEMEEDLEGQLQHFLQTRDHRQAVRYLYLKSLRMLHDRGLIRLRQQSTNREYLTQLGDDPHRGPFSNLMTAYEKVWYGEFPLNDGQFDRLHQYFEDFYKTVRS